MTTRSLTLILPAPLGHDANRMYAALGMGQPSFYALCYAAGALMIGFHAWEKEPARYTSPAAPDGGWEAHGLTAARVAEILGVLVVSDLPYSGAEKGRDEFTALAGSQGVTWGALLPKLPEPGSMVEVKKDEFYQTDQEHFPVVRVVQTHNRNDPSHTDLRDLRALFAVQSDPFNPAPWVQPLGAHDAYQLTNLIGGPQLASHAGKTWRNTAPNNAYAPGVYGWVEVT